MYLNLKIDSYLMDEVVEKRQIAQQIIFNPNFLGALKGVPNSTLSDLQFVFELVLVKAVPPYFEKLLTPLLTY